MTITIRAWGYPRWLPRPLWRALHRLGLTIGTELPSWDAWVNPDGSVVSIPKAAGASAPADQKP